MRESQVEKHLVKRVKELGGLVRKVSWIGVRGAPDRLVMLPAREGAQRSRAIAGGLGGRKVWRQMIPALTAWVELKAPGQKPEPHQAREHKRLEAMGQTVLVLDSIEAVDTWLGSA